MGVLQFNERPYAESAECEQRDYDSFAQVTHVETTITFSTLLFFLLKKRAFTPTIFVFLSISGCFFSREKCC
jgi:hypothetical protein